MSVKTSQLISAVLVLLFLVFVLNGCASKPAPKTEPPVATAPEPPKTSSPAPPAPAPKDLKSISIGAASMGGSYFVIGGAWATLLNQKLNLGTSVEVTGGGVQNYKLVDASQTHFALCDNAIAHQYYYGEKKQNARGILPLFPVYYQFAVLDELPIKSLSDLANYEISLGPAGSGHNSAGRIILESLGITPKKIHNLSLDDSAQLMRDKRIAGLFITSTVPTPVISDLQTTHKIRLLSLTAEEINKVRAKSPYMSDAAIPPKTYKNQDTAIETIGHFNLIIGQKDLSDELVYNVVKATFENLEMMTSATPAAKSITLENVSKIAIPLHVGAIKYYQEKGAKLPEFAK